MALLPYSAVTKYLRGISQQNPYLNPEQDNEEYKLANSLYDKYSQAPQVEIETQDINPSNSSLVSKFQEQEYNLLESPAREYSETKSYTLDDLEKDPEFSTVAERFLKSIGKKENIFEFLRDTDFSISAALARSVSSGGWSDQEKRDYNYLRQKFDNAKLGGVKQLGGLLKDSIIDIVADPINVLALPFIVSTGGLAGAGLAGAARLTGSQAFKQASKKFAQSNIAKTSSIGLTEGSLDAGFINLGNQLTDVQTGLRQGLDASELATQTLVGGGLGASLGILGGGAANLLAKRRIAKPTDEFTLNEQVDGDFVGPKTKEEISRLRKVNNMTETMIGHTVGKSTTPFKQYTENSATLEKFLKYIRYDAMRDIFDRKELEKIVESYGLASVRRGSEYLTDAKKALNNLDRVGFTLKLSKNTNRQLRLVLGDPSIKTDVNGDVIDDRIITAASEIRKVFDRIYKDGRTIIDLDGNQVDPLFQKNQFVKNYFPRHWIFDIVKEKQGKLKELIIKYGHADPLDEIKPQKAFTATGKEIDVVLPDQVSVDQNIFEGYLRGTTSFRELARRELGADATELEIENYAKGLKADAIVDRMIQRKSTPYLIQDLRAGERMSAIQHRPFDNIPDQELIENGFIETDIEKIVGQYTYQMGQNIERARYFGRGVDDFEDKFLVKIRQELRASKQYSDEQVKEVAEGVLNLYRRTTGLDVPTFGKYGTKIADGLKLSQQLAHLPFATISSLTEPFILLSRTDVADTPAVIKAYANAGGKQIKKSMLRFYDRMSALTGKKVKGLRDLNDEEYLEAYRASIALEQAAQDRIQAMYGEAMQGKWTRNISNAFFNLNILQPWTQTVQMAAFTISKEKTARLAKELATGFDSYGLKLTNKGIKRRKEELREIGIDENNAVEAFNNSLVNGKLNEELWKNSAFYNQEVIPSANIFAREIILNPTVAEANKPLLFSEPWAQLLLQFAGYPTAFNNVVLKGAARSMVRDPLVNVPKVMAAATVMTGVASLTNALRSNGRSLEEDEATIIAESVRRWGGMGPLEYPYRFAQGFKYGGGQAGALLKAPTGPLVGDVVDAIAYRNTLPEIAFQNIPGYSALPYEYRKEVKAYLRGTQTEEKVDRPRKPLRRGGEVYDVSNVSVEPEATKMRGLPFTYEEVAGPFVQDQEDRVGFAEGGITKVKTKNELYRQLTKYENIHEIDDQSRILPYKKADFKDFKDKKVYYTSLKEDSNIAKLNAYRKTNKIGMNVYLDKDKLIDPIKLSGHIAIKNPLRLSVPMITPKVIEDNLEKIKAAKKPIDKELEKEIIDDLKYKLRERDYALSKDENIDDDAREIIERSKSFVIRDALLKLGFDSIEYLPKVNQKAFVLLRENQFYPLEVSENKNRLQFNEGGSLEERISNFITNFFYGKDSKPNTVSKQSGRFLKEVVEDRVYKSPLVSLLPEDRRALEDQEKLLGYHYGRMMKENPDLINTSYEQYKQNAKRFADIVREIETGGRYYAKNQAGSSARGAYQFLAGSIDPAIKRTVKRLDRTPRWVDELKYTKDSNRLTPNQQTLLFYGDMLEKRGSDEFMVPALTKGSLDDMRRAYLKYHHTLSGGKMYSDATIKRADDIFTKYGWIK